MDPHCISLLEGSEAVLRDRVSGCTRTPARVDCEVPPLTCASRVENLRWIQENRRTYPLTEQLRCSLTSRECQKGACSRAKKVHAAAANGPSGTLNGRAADASEQTARSLS